jgi:hypothetical protein
MLKKIYQFLQSIFFNSNKFYCGWDKYGCNWVIQFKNDQQYWVIQRKKIIRNAGYYQPYRKMLVLKKLVQGKEICQKN